MIDLVAGSLVAACLVGAVWFGTVGADDTRARITELSRLIQEARRNVALFRAARDRQQAEWTARQNELAQRGHLPDRAPVDEYFRSLSSLASTHQLRVVRHQPLSARQYPGLLEQHFVYEVTGSTGNLIRFLQAIEESAYWADVAYLKVDRGPGTHQAAIHNRVAVLTISLFSSLPTEAPKEHGGT